MSSKSIATVAGYCVLCGVFMAARESFSGGLVRSGFAAVAFVFVGLAMQAAQRSRSGEPSPSTSREPRGAWPSGRGCPRRLSDVPGTPAYRDPS
jgi:hypothetical protein